MHVWGSVSVCVNTDTHFNICTMQVCLFVFFRKSVSSNPFVVVQQKAVLCIEKAINKLLEYIKQDNLDGF